MEEETGADEATEATFGPGHTRGGGWETLNSPVCLGLSCWRKAEPHRSLVCHASWQTHTLRTQIHILRTQTHTLRTCSRSTTVLWFLCGGSVPSCIFRGDSSDD